MPRRTDLNHILVIGSGPIVIGQACEFDYSGTQACRVLRAEGLTVSLVNSNPATIMTDPEYADYTYVEPITAQNHGFALEGERGEVFDTDFGPAIVSHTCANDGVVEGIKLVDGSAFSVQYHPEAAAGPHDANYLFDQFVELMEGKR